jgi:hypothetical protein
VAIGSVPAKSGQITACYSKHGGKMRIIDTSKKGKAGKCRRGERKLTWNQKGVAGTPGTPGAPGTPGPHDFVVRTVNFNSGTSVPFISDHLVVQCSPGEVATGGGIGWTNSPSSNDAVLYSGPVTTSDATFGVPGETPTGWAGEIRTTDMDKSGRLYVICAKP